MSFEGEGKINRRDFLRGVGGVMAASSIPNLSSAEGIVSNHEEMISMPTRDEFESTIARYVVESDYRPSDNEVEKYLLGGLDTSTFLDKIKQSQNVDSDPNLYNELAGLLLNALRKFNQEVNDYAAVRVANMQDHEAFALPDSTVLIEARDELVNFANSR